MWPCYVINLAANTKRMENSARALGAQGIVFERLEAINGWKLSDTEVASVYDAAQNRKRAKHPLVRPEIGCYLSHIECWRRIAESEAAGGFVFEDDISVSVDLAEVLKLVSGDDARDWDILKLFSFDHAPRTVSARALGGKHRLVIPFRVPTCLIGYALTRQAAREMVARAVPFFRPVDEDLKFFWETKMRVALVVPPPVSVGDQEAATGTIGNERRSAKKGSRLLHGLIHQVRYNANLHLYRWLGR